ncbi:MAG: hypothetical protein Q9162_006266 [Coniocarpon cinnabarinum]
MRRLIPELDIFKPVPASLKDENDWPIFTINNAEVTYEGTSELANLLLNDDEHLMTVTGHITQLDREEKCHLIDRDSIPCSITIASVQRFSFGQYDDGVVTFWVRGRAGWFEIVPSRRYKPFLEEMVQVIRILYFLADTLHEMPTRKQQRRANPDTLFRQYAEDDEHKCEDAQAARRRFIKHKRPLLTLMSQGKEGIAWKPTAIYKYLDSHHDEDPDQPKDTQLQTPRRPQADGGSSDDEETAAHLARKGKSSLRPKADPAKGHSLSKGPHTDNGIPVDDGDDVEIIEPLSMASPLRRKSEDPLEDRSPKRRRGRPPKHAPPAPTIAKPSQTNLPAHTNGVTTTPIEPDPLPLKLKIKLPPRKVPTTRVTISTTPLPSFEANTAGDIWTCPFDGCAHRIFGASEPKSKTLMEEHYKMHAHDSQKQLDMAYAEERPYLPVGNLINRIREMAAKGVVPAGQGGREREVPKWKQELIGLQKGVVTRY